MDIQKGNVSWDAKRAKTLSKLDIYFSKVEFENRTFIKKLTDMKINLDLDFMNVYEESICTRLNGVRKAFSTGTPAMESVMGNNKFGLFYVVSKVFTFKESLNKLSEFSLYVEYNTEKIKFDKYTTENKFATLNVIMNEKNPNNIIHPLVKENSFPYNFPKYMNIFLFNKNKNISQFVVDIQKLDIMRSYKLKLESCDGLEKTVIEIALFKYSSEKVNDTECDIYNYLFNEPAILYDHKLDTFVNGWDEITPEIESFGKSISNKSQEYLNGIQKNFEGKFAIEEFRKNLADLKRPEHQLNIQITPEIEALVQATFRNKDIAGVVMEWLKTNQSSFEEIMYVIMIVDPSSLTIYENLKSMFDIAKMKNFLIHNSDCITVTKLKEMIYALYKRFMIYLTKDDTDRIVDYILKKENLINYKWTMIYPKNYEKQINNIVIENDHPNSLLVNIFKKNQNSFVDIDKQFEIINKYLKNQFNVKSLSSELINSEFSYMLSKHKVDSQFDTIRIDMYTENIKIRKTLEVRQENGQISIKDSDKITESSDKDKVIEKILKEEINSLELYNDDNYEISFEKFKDIFFELPFIPDLIRANCGFNYSFSENFIKSLHNVNVEISTSGGYQVRNFIFSLDYDISSHRNSNTVTNFMMNSLIESSNNMQDIVEQIIRKVTLERKDIAEELRDYVHNPKMMTFLIYNKNTKFEEKIRYYDPLYSNIWIRNCNPKSQINIKIFVESNDEVSKMEREIIVKKNGYCKYRFNNEHYEWRECKVKDGISGFNVKFKCLQYPCIIYFFNF